jgi:hypothetical protein
MTEDMMIGLHDDECDRLRAEADALRAGLERVTGERSRAAVAASIASEYTVTLEAKIAALTAQRDAARGALADELEATLAEHDRKQDGGCSCGVLGDLRGLIARWRGAALAAAKPEGGAE